jgi:2'-5' RNA ligase
MLPDAIPVGKGYALWLTPAEPIFSRCARKISRLSREHSTPRFEPHVTLLSRILLPEEKALAKSASLAGTLKPTGIELGEVSHLDEYFRCLFITVVPVGSIIKARRAACRVFGRQNSAYTPHVSLLYGKLPAETRKTIATGLSSLAGKNFHMRSLALCRVSGPPREWKCIRRFTLG